jgi:predicted lipoprotein with Yx(FWY)xxD motif
MFGRFAGAAGVAALALLAVGCGSSSSSSAVGAASSPAGASSSPAVAAVASSPAGAAAANPAAVVGTVLKSRMIGGVAVLTNAAGLTLYWFAPDTSTTSKCTGTCATYWPPVKGPATAGAGVTGKLGTITRADGSVQATYDGHPLYTYVADTAPGQAKGNGINASGGLWYEVRVSGSAAPAAPAAPASSPAATGGGGAPAPSKSATSGGGGYGY